MPQELEIKLTLEPAPADDAYRWLSSLPETSVGPTKRLANTYFDTPDASLNRLKAALRIRKAGDRYIQTLKTQGEFVAGAHRRLEWEWPLPSAVLDRDLLLATSLVDSVSLDELKPVFETNFERRILMLDDGKAVIECAFDRGEIVSGGQSVPLCEVEFELKSGQEDRLLYWASKLGEQVSFFINLISKAEQGYFLAGVHRPASLSAGAEPVSKLFHGLSRLWLTGELPQEYVEAVAELKAKETKTDWRTEIELFERLMAEPSSAKVSDLGKAQLALLRTGVADE
ncbi:CYTH domain-containing protein [Marinobacter salinisoli]|uniref:CYTH domain-containing protein n=2 Tax=Marinobacter salinisoli TaxID=2769486 RepID=A0ABX7MW30_9GAMM|nr:CYTH domain-containing protein [Marinobacter salinisoli]